MGSSPEVLKIGKCAITGGKVICLSSPLRNKCHASCCFALAQPLICDRSELERKKKKILLTYDCAALTVDGDRKSEPRSFITTCWKGGGFKGGPALLLPSCSVGAIDCVRFFPSAYSQQPVSSRPVRATTFSPAKKWRHVLFDLLTSISRSDLKVK